MTTATGHLSQYKMLTYSFISEPLMSSIKLTKTKKYIVQSNKTKGTPWYKGPVKKATWCCNTWVCFKVDCSCSWILKIIFDSVNIVKPEKGIGGGGAFKMIRLKASFCQKRDFFLFPIFTNFFLSFSHFLDFFSFAKVNQHILNSFS